MVYKTEFLEHLYRTMLRIRLAEESLVEPILNGDVRTPCHLYSGQEAIATGLCATLMKNDYVFGCHRSHGHYLAKGGSLKAMMAEIYCREAGCSRGRRRGRRGAWMRQRMCSRSASPCAAGTTWPICQWARPRRSRSEPIAAASSGATIST